MKIADTKTETWSCDFYDCKHYQGEGHCSADPSHIFRYLFDCPEFEPVNIFTVPDIEDLPF